MVALVDITVEDLVRPIPPLLVGSADAAIRWEYGFPTAHGEAAVGLVMDGTHPRSTVLRQWGDDREVVDTGFGFLDFVSPFRGGVCVGFGSECMYRSGDEGDRVLVEVGRNGRVRGDFTSLLHRKIPMHGLTAMGATDEGILVCTENPDRKMYLLSATGDVVEQSALPTQSHVVAITQRSGQQVAVVIHARNTIKVMVGADPSRWEVEADITKPVREMATGYRSTRAGVIESSVGSDRVQRIALR